MNQKRTILGLIIGLPILLIGLFFINSAVYPFTSKDPNFADVEAAFDKLQFPSDWQEIKSTENRGIAGRQCEQFNTSGCFHKGKSFSFTDYDLTRSKLVEVLKVSGGCDTVSEEMVPEGNSNTTPMTLLSVRCVAGDGIYFTGSASKERKVVGVSATTY